jgi:eukaryotic-like serine/threonine-protein kinase
MAIPRTVGKYEILDALGTGGMGTVYRAFDPTLERTVALKIVHLDWVQDVPQEELVKRFRNEARAGARLHHPAIVTIFDFGDQDPAGAYIAMEYVEGCGLDQYIKQRTEPHLEDAISTMQQMLEGLAYAHRQGVVHRDIKPANMLITRDGLVKIMDFGIAKIGLQTLTQTGMIMGTPRYMAPEQYVGGAVDQRCDIHAAGVVLHELLTGSPPYLGTEAEVMYKVCYESPKPLSGVEPAIAQAFDPIVAKALEKTPADRYASAEEFREALCSRWQEISATPPSPTLSERARMIAAAASLSGSVRTDTVLRGPAKGGGATGGGPAARPVSEEGGKPLSGGETGSLTAWSRDQLAEIERQLLPIVGPMARILVREAAATTGNRQEVYRLLADHLRTPEERQQFLRAGGGRTSIGPSSTTPPSAADAAPSSAAGGGGGPLNAEVTQRASQLLARYLGPMARVVTRRAAQTAADESHLYSMLAEKITDTKQRERFLKEAGHSPDQPASGG